MSPIKKRLVVIFAVVGVAALIAVLRFVIVDGSTRGEPIDYYYTDDLKNMRLPAWNPPERIPLPPEKAVEVALNYLRDKHPGVKKWDVDYLEIKRQGSVWIYVVALTDRQSGRYELESVRVLMDGNVWKPGPKR